MTTYGQPGQPLLDQLQTEVNHVLEQTARLLAASSKDVKTVPIAQASKLKNIVPGCIDRFQHALDQLEDELQLAKLVMRRDLAVVRERNGEVKQAPVEPTSAKPVTPAAESVVDQKADEEAPKELNDVVVTEDVSMADVQPDQPPATESTTDLVKTSDSKPEEPTDVSSPKKETRSESVAVLKTEESKDEKPSDQSLQIDTKTQPKPTTGKDEQNDIEEKPPDTGTFSNANDLDSLFGGPMSAGPGEGQDFNMDDPGTTGDFDFDSFVNDADNNGADNDNISSLLPGLQDYANTQPGGSADPDFDTMFSDLPADAEGQGDSGNAMDASLDELMNFADFTGDLTGNEEGGQGNNTNQDFDFDFT